VIGKRKKELLGTSYKLLGKKMRNRVPVARYKAIAYIRVK
jgi:hypothetical protein